MRYIKVLLLVILFFLVMMFFVQNQSAFSQAVALKLDLLFLPPVESAPLPFYTLLIICFVLGALCILAMLMWDRVSLSAKLTMANMRARSFEKDVAKALKSSLEEIAYHTEWEDVQGTTIESCGNYRDHSLFSAKEWSKTILDQGISDQPFERQVVE